MSEKAMNKSITEIYEAIERTLPRKDAQAARAVEKARLLIADVLAKYTNEDGIIPRNKVNAVLTDLQVMDSEIYKYLRDELRLILQDTADDTTLSLAEALVTVYGAKALADFVGLNASVLALPLDVVELLFNLLTSSSRKRHAESAVESAFNRKGEGDQLQLNARLRNVAIVLREEVSKTLRNSIQNGEGTSDILRKTTSNFKDLEWRLATIVETEALYVMRQTLAKFAEASKMVAALKIVDYPHGDAKVHERHKCHIYAHSDEHRLGNGVYPVGTRKIRNPHPRCRSTLHFVMEDKFK